MKRILDNLLGKWKALAPQRRILVVSVTATVLIAAYVLTSRANQVDWAVLYANVDDATASEVMASLDGKGIEYKLDGNGTRILVPAGSLNTTRIALANEGISGQAVPDGFAEIFDNQGLSTTDFAEKVNYERALEGELARTLLAMEAVSGANVQLSIPEKSVFIGQRNDTTSEASASVLLQLRRPLTQEEVDTVANVVSSSVPDLSIEQVTVASTDGALLKAPGDARSSVGSSSLEVTQAYETRLQNQLTALVRNIPGAHNATVTVTADLSFGESTVQTEKIDPTNNTDTATHTVEENWEGTGSYPGGEVGVDGGPIDTGLADSTSTYQKLDTTTQTQVGERTIESTTDSTPTVKRLGIAVVIPASADMVDSLESAGIEDIVRAAANAIDTDERSDLVQVAIVPVAGAGSGSSSGTDVQLVTEPVATPGGVSPYLIIVGFLIGAIGVVILGIARKRRLARKAAEAAAAEKLAAIGADPALAQYLNLAPDKESKDSDGAKGKDKDKGKKKGKKKKGEEDEDGEVDLSGFAPSPEADRDAMDAIRGDLEKLLAESPESLAGLLSNWMTK
ncbi:MAG: flagellar basal-body MS-ring/collar protein FliF [Ilumatobacteraceae bacterium]